MSGHAMSDDSFSAVFAYDRLTNNHGVAPGMPLIFFSVPSNGYDNNHGLLVDTSPYFSCNTIVFLTNVLFVLFVLLPLFPFSL